jgi:hypothetical protein
VSYLVQEGGGYPQFYPAIEGIRLEKKADSSKPLMHGYASGATAN